MSERQERTIDRTAPVNLGPSAPAEGNRPWVCRGLEVRPLDSSIARDLLTRHHYLHSWPGGTQMAMGVFADGELRGAMTLGVGPANIHRLVDGASRSDSMTLTRLWLADTLPRNSESWVIGQVLRAMRRHTAVKFVVSYADPSHGHVGVIYQAANFSYTGLSQPTPLYDLGDGVHRHSRSISTALGSRDRRFLRARGVTVTLVPQSRKHRYVYFLDRRWRDRLLVPVLPYPKKEDQHGDP